MNSEQQLAFRLASGVTAEDLLLSIAATIVILLLVWSSWVTLGAFRLWQQGNTSLLDLSWCVLRLSILLMAVAFYVG